MTVDIRGTGHGEKAGLSEQDARGTGGDDFRFHGYRMGGIGGTGQGGRSGPGGNR